MKKYQPKQIKLFWLVLGLASCAIGTIGIVVPFLPTVPFYMATVFCFAKSSQKLHDKFVASKMYQKHLASYAKDRSMTISTKIRIMISMTIVIGTGFYFMQKVPVARAVLVLVWLGHFIYFFFRVKTKNN